MLTSLFSQAAAAAAAAAYTARLTEEHLGNGKFRFSFYFFDYTVQLRHSQRMHTHTLMNTRVQILPYEHLRRPSRQILKIDKVITGASLRSHGELKSGPQVLPRVL